MNETEIREPEQSLSCEACGNPFNCGAKNGNCWCFKIAISPEDLAQLKEQFESCLCRDCLQKFSLPENKNS